MVFRFFGSMSAVTGVQDVMPGFIQRDFSGFGGMFVILIRISAVPAVTGNGASMFGIIIGFPFTIRKTVFLCFRTGVAAGAGTRAAVFGIGNARPVSGGDAVICVFRAAVRTAGTGNGTLMLGIGIVCPCSAGQTVTGIFRGAVRTAGAGNRAFMLTG